MVKKTKRPVNPTEKADPTSPVVCPEIRDW